MIMSSSTAGWYNPEVKRFKKQLPSPGLTELVVRSLIERGHHTTGHLCTTPQRGTAGCQKDWVVTVWDSSHLRGNKARSESFHRSWGLKPKFSASYRD